LRCQQKIRHRAFLQIEVGLEVLIVYVLRIQIDQTFGQFFRESNCDEIFWKSGSLCFQFNAETWYKTPTGKNYRLLMDLKDIDACDVVKNLLNYPMMTNMVNWLNTTFTGAVHTCPYDVSPNLFLLISIISEFFYDPQSFKVTNITHYRINPSNDVDKQWQFYPTGNYKTVFRITDRIKEEIAWIIYFSEFRSHYHNVVKDSDF
jgi:hypothetical protein